MTVVPAFFSRTGKVAALCGAALVLTVPSAVATVTPTIGASSVQLISDNDGDQMVLTCSSGQLKDSNGPDLIACNVVQTINVQGNGGNDIIDLSALQAADLPNLRFVSLGGGSEVDNIKGSFFGDVIDAGSTDTVQGFGGDDIVSLGDSVFGGDGDDILSMTQGFADGGAGDDRIINPGSGPYDGGTGHDSLEVDFAPLVSGLGVNVVLTDTVLHLDIPAIPASVDAASVNIERYVMGFPYGGSHTWNSAAYSGDSAVTGAEGADKITGGPGEDFLDGREGNDQLVGGAGFDHLDGGAGDDAINSQDGAVDRVICGIGNDTVVADANDVLTGCENVQLPVVPPPPPPPPAPPVVPVTGALKGPKSVVQGDKAKFTFSSATVGATFQCKLDGAAWKACTSPHKVATKKLTASKAGTKHVLKVRAVLAGVVDATPVKKAFLVLKP